MGITMIVESYERRVQQLLEGELAKLVRAAPREVGQSMLVESRELEIDGEPVTLSSFVTPADEGVRLVVQFARRRLSGLASIHSEVGGLLRSDGSFVRMSASDLARLGG